jgi:predicted ATP-grasp superfamily ATP-dependent carboligase
VEKGTFLEMKDNPDSEAGLKHESAVISGIHNVNALGVVRGLARRGIPITLLDVDRRSMVRYSRFVSRRVSCPHPQESAEGFVQCLVEWGRGLDHKPVIIPTGDAEVMALSRHRDTLETYYRIPLSPWDTVDLLVNKKRFFQEAIRRSIPCPRSYFPETTDEARNIAANIPYPFIVKAAYSHEFITHFHKKVFVVHSPVEFETAVEQLQTTGLDYFLQEIVPGNALFLFYSYFSRQSVPLGVCGYDKVRQFPRDFGIGTLCRTIHRSQPIQTAVDFLKSINYHGLAEPEFKHDPRDGQYKLIEINTRSVTMTLLTQACGVPMEHLAYLDLLKGNVEPAGPATEGVLWIDEINELHYQLSRIRRGLFSFSELSTPFRGKKIFACAAADDPIPLLVGLARFFYERYKAPRNVDTMLGI